MCLLGVTPSPAKKRRLLFFNLLKFQVIFFAWFGAGFGPVPGCRISGRRVSWVLLPPKLVFHLFFHLLKTLSQLSSSQKKGNYYPENELKSKIQEEKVKNEFHERQR